MDEEISYLMEKLLIKLKEEDVLDELKLTHVCKQIEYMTCNRDKIYYYFRFLTEKKVLIKIKTGIYKVNQENVTLFLSKGVY